MENEIKKPIYIPLTYLGKIVEMSKREYNKNYSGYDIYDENKDKKTVRVIINPVYAFKREIEKIPIPSIKVEKDRNYFDREHNIIDKYFLDNLWDVHYEIATDPESTTPEFFVTWSERIRFPKELMHSEWKSEVEKICKRYAKYNRLDRKFDSQEEADAFVEESRNLNVELPEFEMPKIFGTKKLTKEEVESRMDEVLDKMDSKYNDVEDLAETKGYQLNEKEQEQLDLRDEYSALWERYLAIMSRQDGWYRWTAEIDVLVENGRIYRGTYTRGLENRPVWVYKYKQNLRCYDKMDEGVTPKSLYNGNYILT